METQEKLINEFIEAIEKWAEEAETHPMNATFYAVLFTGMFWFVKRVGGVEDPTAPEHAGKTYGEVHGRHTLEQVRDYLLSLAEERKLMADFLVIGLAHAIRQELERLVVDFDQGKRRVEASMAKILDWANHPEEHEEWIAALTEDGNVSRDEAIERARLFAKKPPIHKGPDDLAKNKRLLSKWDEVVMPLVSREGLRAWRREFWDEGLSACAGGRSLP